MESLEGFRHYLHVNEMEFATQKAYVGAVKQLLECSGCILEKEWLIGYREKMKEKYSVTTVNAKIAAINRYLEFQGKDWRLRYMRVQKRMYIEPEKELTKKEYMTLLEASQSNPRLYMIIQTICSTGIRVSELRYIRTESLKEKTVKIMCKGKVREIMLPDLLVKRLEEYCRERKIEGEIFVTRTGKPVSRSHIWADMKKVSIKAEVESGKVYPHNLRHLFAKVYYENGKDLVKLADILGHSSTQTTRRYLISDGKEQRKQLNALGLVR